MLSLGCLFWVRVTTEVLIAVKPVCPMPRFFFCVILKEYHSFTGILKSEYTILEFLFTPNCRMTYIKRTRFPLGADIKNDQRSNQYTADSGGLLTHKPN